MRGVNRHVERARDPERPRLHVRRGVVELHEAAAPTVEHRRLRLVVREHARRGQSIQLVLREVPFAARVRASAVVEDEHARVVVRARERGRAQHGNIAARVHHVELRFGRAARGRRAAHDCLLATRLAAVSLPNVLPTLLDGPDASQPLLAAGQRA